MDHSKMNHSSQIKNKNTDSIIAAAGNGTKSPVIHRPSEYGPQVDMLAESPASGISDPGVGLRNNGRRVLTYADLYNLNDTPRPA